MGAQGNLAVLNRGAVLGGFTAGLIGPFVPLFFRNLGGSYIALGGVISVSLIVSTVLGLMGGYFTDRVGRRNIVVFFSFLGIFGPVLYFFVRDWKAFFIVSIIGTIGSFASPAGSAMLADSLPKDKRTTALSVFQSASLAPSIVMPIIGGWIMGMFGIDFGFRIAALIAAFFAVLGFINAMELKETFPEAGTRERGPKERFQLTQSVKANMGAYGLVMLANAVASPFYILFATEIIKLSPLQWGTIISFQSLGAVLFKIPGGVVTDAIGKKRIMMVSVALVAVVPTLFTFSKGFNDAFFYSMLLVALGMFYGQAAQSLLIDQTPQSMRGRVSALWDGVNNGSRAAGSAMGGFLYSFGPAFPFYFFTLAELAAVWVMMWIEEHRD